MLMLSTLLNGTLISMGYDFEETAPLPCVRNRRVLFCASSRACWPAWPSPRLSSADSADAHAEYPPQVALAPSLLSLL